MGPRLPCSRTSPLEVRGHELYSQTSQEDCVPSSRCGQLHGCKLGVGSEVELTRLRILPNENHEAKEGY